MLSYFISYLKKYLKRKTKKKITQDSKKYQKMALIQSMAKKKKKF